MAESNAPIAWTTLEKGTPVISSDGVEIGKVVQVIGDEQRDIFSGITLRAGLLDSERFAPADAIERVTQAHVALKLSERDARMLEPYET